MYDTLKELMPSATYFYGPMTKEQAFSIPVPSFAVSVGSHWYSGVNEPVEGFTPIS